MVKLYDHSHLEKAPPRESVLSLAGFLRFVSAKDQDALFGENGKRNDLCTDVFFRADKTLPYFNEAIKGNGGWFVVVRGSLVSEGELASACLCLMIILKGHMAYAYLLFLLYLFLLKRG